MKRVYTAANLIDAQLLLDHLLDAGIPALVFHGNAQGALGELPVTHPEVWIKRDPDAERAHKVITEFESRSADDAPRRCSHCGEPNPGAFEICWRCGRGL
ncbi:MAG: DUF2007 domain-containing protein [Pseudomonadota bacterium]|nr:DUF2007 domain-containing protein [Pseudomonadota bacterium]